MPTRASASTLWPPPLLRVLVNQKEQAAEESHIRLDTGGRQGSLKSSRRCAAVTSRWRSRALSQSWALGFPGPERPWRAPGVAASDRALRAARGLSGAQQRPRRRRVRGERTALPTQAAPSRHLLPSCARVGGKPQTHWLLGGITRLSAQGRDNTQC